MNAERRFSWKLPLLLFGGALLGVWLLDERRKNAPEASIEHPDNADYYALNAKITGTNSQGKLAYQITTSKALYYPDGTSALEQVHAYSLGGSKSAWDLSSENGRVTADRNRIDLTNNVNMQGEIGGSPVNITSDAMSIFPNTEVLETNAEVTIQGENYLSNSVGIRAEFTTRRLELLSDVKTTITQKKAITEAKKKPDNESTYETENEPNKEPENELTSKHENNS